MEIWTLPRDYMKYSTEKRKMWNVDVDNDMEDYVVPSLKQCNCSLCEEFRRLPLVSKTITAQLIPGFATTPSFANMVNKQQEKENTMQTLNIVAHAAQTNERSPEDRQKNHLLDRLRQLKNEKNETMRVNFGLSELPRPQSPAELVEYIKTGKYVFKHEEDLTDTDFACSEFYYSPWRYIEFRDPAVKVDHAGYEKALKALDKLYDDTKDEIIVKSPEDALAALRQFESTTVNYNSESRLG
jgi:hypothetical protein